MGFVMKSSSRARKLVVQDGRDVGRAGSLTIGPCKRIQGSLRATSGDGKPVSLRETGQIWVRMSKEKISIRRGRTR